MAFDLNSAHRRKSAANPCENDTQIVIYLSGGSNCRARILGIDLLLDCNRRRYALNGLDIRLAHSSQELSRIR